ncbi:hypothetical protein N7G274_005852 [Stereocaulon virgatum]|uniref:Uncharacterized protein n=1 Tax=Stereocaulon virgatum TaxID=373712 RepID=A0ABR4A7K7_9LECA
MHISKLRERHCRSDASTEQRFHGHRKHVLSIPGMPTTTTPLYTLSHITINVLQLPRPAGQCARRTPKPWDLAAKSRYSGPKVVVYRFFYAYAAPPSRSASK